MSDRPCATRSSSNASKASTLRGKCVTPRSNKIGAVALPFFSSALRLRKLWIRMSSSLARPASALEVSMPGIGGAGPRGLPKPSAAAMQELCAFDVGGGRVQASKRGSGKSRAGVQAGGASGAQEVRRPPTSQQACAWRCSASSTPPPALRLPTQRTVAE
eukprot:CAMPEP_0119488658 /NCGR_PEP_ID=MMETSP1344-20130328/14362_1 /TAXON_ID=236787 /ORGANISM="Florenciella parvula, Strain CCMP2471" /LENGTH=159 /DNA_ID=CAMNT_0007523629 /DNA_START=926 /DNA_END=1406 /DNA_ORIENTATION=-